MRRSKAPSIRKMAKNTSFDSNANVNSFRSPSPPMQWGTSNGYQHWGPKNYEDNENPLKDKRIFRILWRNISNRKHKIWNGDGTLEVTAADATLKDHTGKIMGALKTFNFNPRDFKEHELLQIAGKEVELQEEFKTIEECVAQRKQEIALAFHVESDDEENNHNRPQKVNMLKAPKRAPVARALTEYICMLRPAELQLWALKVCEQYAQAMPAGHQFSDDIVNISRWICDHPAIVKNHANPTSQLMLRLLEHLPPAKEMQIYDSAKFECVQMLLDNLVVEHGERCAIIATNAEILDIIKGYCEYYGITHIKIDTNIDVARFNRSTSDVEAPMVAFLDSRKLPTQRLQNCANLIVYNNDLTEADRSLLMPVQAVTKIYTLITTGCIEERLFQRNFHLVEDEDPMDMLLRPPLHPTHEMLANNPSQLDPMASTL